MKLNQPTKSYEENYLIYFSNITQDLNLGYLGYWATMLAR